MAKTIGIIGGMTPESTTMYYEYITRTHYQRFGDYGFPRIIIYSVSFQQYEDWMIAGDWAPIAMGLTEAAQSLVDAGADFGLLATNTMHKVLPEILESVPLPMLSIIDVTAEEIKSQGLEMVGLLGTRFTMEETFYVDGLAALGITALVPNADDRNTVNEIIFKELGTGLIREDSRKAYVDVVNRLQDRGAQGVILGCTEIPLLLRQKDCDLPLFNTTLLHAEKALQFALSD